MRSCFDHSLLMVLACMNVHGQSFDGVYVGEMISLKSALVISTTGNIAVGQLHENEFDKHAFFGTAEFSTLTGSFVLNNKQEIFIHAELRSDTLKGIYGPFNTRGKGLPFQLIKISSNPKYNIHRIYKGERLERDPALVGRWQNLKRIKEGVDDLSFFPYWAEFAADGRFQIEEEAVRRMFNETMQRAGLSQQVSFDDLRPGISLMRWSTKNNRLILKSEHPLPPQIDSYELRSDTLILTSLNGTKTFAIRMK